MKLLLPNCIAAVLILCTAVASARNLEPRYVNPCGDAPVVTPPATPSIASAELPWRLTLHFEDADGGAPLAVRVGVFDGSGRPIVPDDPAAALYQAVWLKNYFYADGEFEIGAPEGAVTVRVGHGFEYQPLDTTVVVSGNTVLVLRLHRIADLAAVGWFSGDTHIHIGHPPVNYSVDDAQADLAARAEALAFANILELEDRFTGDVHPLSDADHIVYFSMENRNAHFGHLTVVGLKEWLPDPGCATPYMYCGATLNKEICDAAHAQGSDVLVIATHPFSTLSLADASPWPGGGVWRGMSMDLVEGVVDAVDLLCYTNDPSPDAIAFYPEILNAGFRLPPSAGTDANLASSWSYPPGGYRVYVKSSSGQLDLDGWVGGLRRGTSFVTSHPLITSFKVGGAGIGGTCGYGRRGVKAELEVVSAFPVDRVELIADVGVVASADAPGDGRSFRWTVSFDPTGLHWVLARVTGAANDWHVYPSDALFAQTAPVWLEPSFGLAPAATATAEDWSTRPGPEGTAANYFKGFNAEVKRLFQGPSGSFPGAGSRSRFDAAIGEAETFYEQLHLDPPLPFELIAPADSSWALGRPAVWTPRPDLRWEAAVDPEGDDVTYMVLIDTSPGFPAPLIYGGLTGPSIRLPAEAGLQDGTVYYWKVVASDPLGNRRESAVSDFVVVLTSTPAITPPVSWAFDEPWPNPFFSAVSLRYSVPAEGARVRITVFDAAGRVVRHLLERDHAAGPGEISWDGRDDAGSRAPSGVYFFQMERPGAAPLARRAILLK